MKTTHWFAASSALALSLAAGLPAAAATSTDLEELVVTATRREVSLADVPAAVSALSEQQLLQRGARDLQDYVLTVPGVSFADPGEEIGQGFVIRGVSSLGSSATTTTYVDETPVPSDLRLFDVDRVEVLRGPQGTLFGASTMGGAIRTLTRKPDTREASGLAEATVSGTANAKAAGYSLNGAFNLPLAEDLLALRVSAYRDREQGYVRSFRSAVDVRTGLVQPTGEVLQARTGDVVVTGARAALRYTPTSKGSLTATYYWQEDEQRGFNTADADLYGRGLSQARTFKEGTTETLQLGNLTAEWDLGFADLVSSTSYRDTDGSTNTDATAIFYGLTQRLNAIPGLGGFLTGQSRTNPIVSHYDSGTFTQEVRLTSNGDGPLRWLAGAYHSDEDFARRQRILVGPVGASALPGGAMFDSRQRSSSTDTSLFGEVAYDLTPALTASAGVRRYWLGSKVKVVRDGPLARAGGDLVTGPLKADESGYTYRFNLAWKATERLLVYAQAASGYRPGGANTSNPLGGTPGEPVTPLQYTSDTLWQYEAGFRAGLLDGRASVNGSVYYTAWKDIQSVRATPSGFNYQDNFGKAHTQGVELEAAMRWSEAFSTGASFAFTEAEFDQANVDEDILKGDPIPLIPRTSWNLWGEYRPTVAAAYEGFIRADLSRVGKREVPLGATARLETYSLLDLRAGATVQGFEISAFLDNALDQKRVVGARSISSNLRLSYLRPRTGGVRVRKAF